MQEGDGDKLSLEFASLGVGELPMCDPSTIRGDFESIRDVFKKAKVRGGDTKRFTRSRERSHGWLLTVRRDFYV